MRTYGITLGALTLALGLLGCAGDVGESGSLLRAVDEDAMTSQVLYMAPDVSAIPLTLGQLEEQGVDPAVATPVRVEIFDDIAVAWFAPAGEAVISRSSIIALWTVVNRQPIAGELADGAGISVTEPTDGFEVPRLVGDEPVSNETQLRDGIDVQYVTTTPVEQTIIDFMDRVGTPEELWFLGQLGGYHPGCI